MKHIADWTVSENSQLSADFCLLKVRLNDELPEIRPGQFVQILVPNAPHTFLRRPISVHFVDYDRRELWLLVQIVGDGSRQLSKMQVGESLNIVYPLGNGFTLPSPSQGERGAFLLIGGGAGTAPLLYLGKQLRDLGYQPTFLLGGRTKNQLLQLSEFEKYGEVHTTTEDGSFGEKGFVTNHSIIQMYFDDIQKHRFDMQTHSNDGMQMYVPSLYIYVCGPKPMMMAVAKLAKQNDIPCEVSLENRMACGIGACLCCVEKTTYGNACVCTAGPVFNINQLKWQI
ncbi:dihydroorotate dehydrogenase B (NAD(+)), electron transfer subunit [Bacteroidia bacterium]|nr:dihydroorotate dehydrogenase B (NAD(+)), electron transfer subunit [Bacteroidia bacterium]